jgi:hypothetical protein
LFWPAKPNIVDQKRNEGAYMLFNWYTSSHDECRLWGNRDVGFGSAAAVRAAAKRSSKAGLMPLR